MKSENDIIKSELHKECKSATESLRREFGLSRILEKSKAVQVFCEKIASCGINVLIFPAKAVPEKNWWHELSITWVIGRESLLFLSTAVLYRRAFLKMSCSAIRAPLRMRASRRAVL
jgi:hypothetical protein